MDELVAPEQCAEAPDRDLWQSIPLDFLFCVFLVILAAGLKLAGLLP